MPDPTAIAAVATVASAATKYKSAGKAGEAAAAGYERGAQFNKQMYDDAVARASTQMQAGDAATNRLMELLGVGPNTGAQGYGQFGGPFTMETFKADPFYQYSLGQGVKDLERTAAARGGLLSGATIRGYKDVQGREYENAFNRYYTGRANTLAPYQSLMGTGAQVVGNLGGAAQRYAQGAGDAYQSGGAARATGYINQANVLSNALMQGAGAYGQYGNPFARTPAMPTQAVNYQGPMYGGGLG
jgi:hypothetical protein